MTIGEANKMLSHADDYLKIVYHRLTTDALDNEAIFQARLTIQRAVKQVNAEENS